MIIAYVKVSDFILNREEAISSLSAILEINVNKKRDNHRVFLIAIQLVENVHITRKLLEIY